MVLTTKIQYKLLETLEQNSTKNILQNHFFSPIEAIFLFSTLVCPKKHHPSVPVLPNRALNLRVQQYRNSSLVCDRENNKTIVRVTDRKDTCINIPSDTYPIQLCSGHSFLIHHHHEPIISTVVQIQDFAEYIKSIPRWIYLLIHHNIVYPSSDSLPCHICN